MASAFDRCGTVREIAVVDVSEMEIRAVGFILINIEEQSAGGLPQVFVIHFFFEDGLFLFLHFF